MAITHVYVVREAGTVGPLYSRFASALRPRRQKQESATDLLLADAARIIAALRDDGHDISIWDDVADWLKAHAKHTKGRIAR